MTTMLCVVSLQQQIAMGNGWPIYYRVVGGKVDFWVPVSQIFTLSLYVYSIRGDVKMCQLLPIVSDAAALSRHVK